MNKELYIENLYVKLKDKIKFDEDVRALSTILTQLLKINPEKSINYWLYIMRKYSLKALEREIDFTPLITEYLLELLKIKDLKIVLTLIEETKKENSIIIKKTFINIFHKQSGIYKYIEKLIKSKKQKEEFTALKLIIKANEDNKISFDMEIFLKNILLLHIKHNEIDISFLLKITNLPQNEKDKALLQTLLIDYI